MMPLRFPIVPQDGESIPGAIARGVRLNVLESSGIAFPPGRYRQYQVPRSAIAPPDELSRLARFLGCPAEKLIDRAGVAVATGSGSYRLTFGDLELKPLDMEMRTRRIAPRTLRSQPWHRSDWQLRNLPYCPVSLERLVEACDCCGAKLAWARCWGIGICEHCRATVSPSNEPALPAALGPAYRLFAGLMSANAAARRRAIEDLPPELRNVPPGSLASLALRLGALTRNGERGASRLAAIDCEPREMGETIDRGIRLLRSWPGGLRGWTAECLDRRTGDLASYRFLRRTIRRLGRAVSGDEAQAALIRAALPDEFGSFVESNRPPGAVTRKELHGRLNLSTSKIDLIREDLEARRLPGLSRKRSQFDGGRVAEFLARYAGAVPLKTFASRIGFPLYAVEQLVLAQLLEWEDHPPVVKLKGMCTTERSISSLSARLAVAASARAMPPGAVDIHRAARTIGGREKPWSALLSAMIDGDLEFWFGGELGSGSLRVLPEAIVPFRRILAYDVCRPGFVRAELMSKRDAQEVLNANMGELSQPAWEGLLEFVDFGRGHGAPKAAVLEIAKQAVFGPELSRALDVNGVWLGWHLDELGVQRFANGWLLQTLADAGIEVLRET